LSLDERLREVVDGTLRMFGESVPAVTYYYLEARFGVKRSEVPLKLDVLSQCLKDLFGPLSAYIEKALAEQVSQQVEVKLGVSIEREGLKEIVDALSRVMKVRSTIVEHFKIPAKLSSALMEAASSLLSSKGLYVKGARLSEEGGSLKAVIQAEGGTVWTTDFDKHYKQVELSFSSTDSETLVEVKLELPGALMSQGDRAKAQRWMEEAFEQLKKASEQASR